MQTRQEITTPLTFSAWHSCYEGLKSLLSNKKENPAQEYLERLESIKSRIEETMRKESQTTFIQGYVFTPQIESLQNLYDALIKQTEAVELNDLSRLIQTFLKNNSCVLEKINPKDISNGTYIIPFGVTSIGIDAFRGCTTLTTITIPLSLIAIGSGAFQDCTALSTISIPASVTSIGWFAFRNCTALTSIRIPGSVTSIGNYAFYNCKALTSIGIPAGLISIGQSAFYNCTALTSIRIPGSVISIGNYAFYNCKALTSIAIPAGLISIGQDAFDNCTALTTIIIDTNNQQRYEEILRMFHPSQRAMAKRIDLSAFQERFVTTMVNERVDHGFFGGRKVPGEVTGIILSKLSKTYDLPPLDERATGKCVNDKITASLVP